MHEWHSIASVYNFNSHAFVSKWLNQSKHVTRRDLERKFPTRWYQRPRGKKDGIKDNKQRNGYNWQQLFFIVFHFPEMYVNWYHNHKYHIYIKNNGNTKGKDMLVHMRKINLLFKIVSRCTTLLSARLSELLAKYSGHFQRKKSQINKDKLPRDRF